MFIRTPPFDAHFRPKTYEDGCALFEGHLVLAKQCGKAKRETHSGVRSCLRVSETTTILLRVKRHVHPFTFEQVASVGIFVFAIHVSGMLMIGWTTYTHAVHVHKYAPGHSLLPIPSCRCQPKRRVARARANCSRTIKTSDRIPGGRIEDSVWQEGGGACCEP